VNSLSLVLRCVFYEDGRIADLMKTNDNGVAMTRQKKETGGGTWWRDG